MCCRSIITLSRIVVPCEPCPTACGAMGCAVGFSFACTCHYGGHGCTSSLLCLSGTSSEAKLMLWLDAARRRSGWQYLGVQGRYFWTGDLTMDNPSFVIGSHKKPKLPFSHREQELLDVGNPQRGSKHAFGAVWLNFRGNDASLISC